MTTSTRDRPPVAPTPDPTLPSATEAHDDATTGHPSAGTGSPATAPVDKSNWLWCRGCNSAKPPTGRKGFRCAECTAKAAKSPNRWLFDSAGNVISKGQSAKKPLYDSEGRLIKANAK